MELHFKIFRYDPHADKGPYFKHYTVKAEPEERILDCLNRIRWEQDGTLSYRMSCGHGVCGSDGMKINGTCRLACQALARDYQCPEVVVVLAAGLPGVKRSGRRHRPFPGKKSKNSWLTCCPAVRLPSRKEDNLREENKKLDEAIRCILCACCTASCPVNWISAKYVGPAALVWAYRYIFDSRDGQTLERLRQLDTPDGAWGCVNHFECTRVCPKEIPVTRSINTIKREIEKKLRKQAGK